MYMKKVRSIIIFTILTICILTTNIYAYENDIFKIDLPSDYAEMSVSGVYIFTKNEEKGIIIHSVDSVGLKKNISTMSKDDVEELIDIVLKDDVNILEQKKEKLGKAKAIKARAENDGDYLDLYIVVSDKHILLVMFTAPTEAELDNEEYLEIKDSFKMKERTTNATFVKILGVLAVGAGVVFKYRKKFF